VIYIDSSSLLKVLWNEAESVAVVDGLTRVDVVVVSVLTELETLAQLKAAFLGGDYNRPRWRQMEGQFSALRNQPPYEFRNLSSVVFQTALRQHRNSRDVHCRTLDRLHLAAMEELEVTRLMTHDERQARAAREAGFEVVQPGRR
jgi:predicted nucleic acid-binding protein